uniref:cGMP-dependent protein kinase n=1 Tax=Odontella aurita TaxID=265563 RepID=A0A7S4NAI1_9STRA
MGVSAQRTFGDLFKGGYSWSGAAAAAGTGGKGEEGSGDNASAGAGAAAAAGAGGTGIDSTARRLDEGFRRRVAEAKDGLARLAVVFAAPLELTHDFIAPVHAKTDEEKEFLLKCLGESFLFEELDRRERDTLVEAFEKKRVSKNESVITQGEVGDYFYVIESGKVKYVVDGKEVGKGGKGDTFGELALLYNSPRAATVVPLQPCELWRVDQLTFKRIIATYQLKEDAETKALLKEVDFLKDLDESALAKIAYLMGTKTYKAGEEIMHEGDPVTNFILIKKGKVRSSEYTAGGKRMEAMEFGVGKNFGSGLLMMGADAPVTVTAIEDTTLLYLGKSAFLKTCGDYESLIQKSADKRVLQMMSIHGKRNLAPSVVGHLASVLVNVKYSKGKVFYREGEAVTPGLYIVRTGEVTVECSEEEPKTVGPMGVFGEETVAEGSPKNEQLISKHTVTALTDIEIGYLGCSTIRKVLGPAEGEDELSKSVAEDGRPIQMDDLNRHRILGAGTFGQVWLVNRKGTKDAYALKIQFKRQLIDSNQAEGVIREKNIMAHLHSDFIIKLVATYQDAENAYMLMKLYQGGELWSVMHGGDGGLPELAARFYMASVLEGLTYMHRRSVIYRDLKPENVLLGSDGYTVIVDLGFGESAPSQMKAS